MFGPVGVVNTQKNGKLGTKDEWFTSFFKVLPPYSPKKLRNKRINLSVSFL